VAAVSQIVHGSRFICHSKVMGQHFFGYQTALAAMAVMVVAAKTPLRQRMSRMFHAR
jgi:hypothetical protein